MIDFNDFEIINNKNKNEIFEIFMTLFDAFIQLIFL